MGTIIIFEIVSKSVLCFLLFSLVSSTVNECQNVGKRWVYSLIAGTMFGLFKLLILPSVAETLLCGVVVFTSIYVLYNPTTLKKFILLDVIAIAYILIRWGLGYLIQLIFFKFFVLTFVSYMVYRILFGFLILILGFIVCCFFKLNYKHKNILSFVYNVFIEFNQKSFKLKMFLDSGNSLYDETLEQLPVLIVSKKSLEKSLGKALNFSSCRQIETQTINGRSKIPILKPRKIMIEKDEKIFNVQAVLGVINETFKLYDGLLHQDLV